MTKTLAVLGAYLFVLACVAALLLKARRSCHRTSTR
jgi:hypothetical protein